MNNEQSKDEAEKYEKPKVTLDTILVNEIGQFGKFQLKTLILTAIIVIFTSFCSTEWVFTTGRINTRCLIPECDDSQPEWSPYWLPNAIPPVGPNNNTLDNCKRYGGNTSMLLQQVESETCPNTLFDTNVVQDCEEFVYEHTKTIVYDFGLACDEWARSIIGTIGIFGTLVALPITGFISDTWGRRIALTLSAFNAAWIGMIRYWSTSYLYFILAKFFEAVLGSGSFSSCYILLMEVMGPRYRVAGGAAMNTFFSIGQVLLGLIAWGIPYWRNLILVLYIPQFLSILYVWLITESVRWYMSKGRFDESDALLKKMAKMNGTQVSDASLQALRDTALEEEKLKELENKRKSQEPWLIVQVFQHKRILIRCMISPIWWITNTFIYYGLSINAVGLTGNMYLNFVAVSAIEIPGYWTAFFLLGIIGRKLVLIGAFWACAACQIAYVFIPNDQYAVLLTVYLIAKFSIAMVMTSVYVYTMELYPTSHRHSLFAFSSMIGRIGSMVAPLTPAIGAEWFEELPFVLFGSFALLSGALTFITPETLGTKLPDSFEEASQIGLKPKS